VQAWPSPQIPRLDGSAPALSLYDTASRSVRPTEPGPVATMYVCGITPYDATHMGHAATYLAFDLIHRYWLAAGHRVRYVQNVTDIDDPLLERAERDGIDWRDLAVRETDLFRSDMTALRVIPPEQYIGAVEAMDEISAAVAELLAAGAGYRVDDQQYPDVYFDITTTGRFGQESGFDEATMVELSAERGGDPDRPGKRQRLDPLLWRMARPGEPAWPSPLGAGRPGWHIECSVIATNRLGARIDLQGGGSDLIFPHHECSAAHAEALSGEHPFAAHYVHTGMMTLGGEKMSKSLGNLAFVSKLVGGGADPIAIRAALLDGHYRVDRPWSDDLLARATERLATWRAAAARSGEPADKTVTTILEALADDLDSPRALRALDAWAADGSLGGDGVAVAADALLGLALLD
jgi:L-cysteine:1D-myo-inositol 2-amino-2-deoxy-alpha-D-glucopyranoside ligase